MPPIDAQLRLFAEQHAIHAVEQPNAERYGAILRKRPANFTEALAEWSVLQEEACPLLREISIWRGDLAPMQLAGSAEAA